LKGLILIFTGDGKGKTTAALGTALRAVGQGMKVLMIQFMKKNGVYGEEIALKRLRDMQILQFGAGFHFEGEDKQPHIDKAQEGWNFAKNAITSGRYDMIILDEINYAIHYGFLEVGEVVSFLKNKPESLHIILTGRNANPQLLDIADLVTEMKEIKHHYKSGTRAQKGIEY
jgi:cob(I)alamin adenosyltransferase